MLQSSSHLSRVCGQSHYKKFWLMQTQMDKQENCCVGSPSTRSVPASVKGPESKSAAPLSAGNSTAARNFVLEAAPQTGRPSWSITGAASNSSNGTGSVGVLSGNGTLLSLTTCAESLSPFRPDDRLSRLPFIDCGSTDCMDMRETEKDVEAGREVSNLSAPFSPYISPSCLTLRFPEYGAHERVLQGSGTPRETEILRQRDSDRIHDTPPVSTQSVRASLALSMSSSLGSESLDLSTQKKTSTSEDELPSFASSSTERHANTESHSPEGVLFFDGNTRDACIDSSQSGLHGPCIEVRKLSQTSPIAGKGELSISEALTPSSGRNSLRSCKLCGTTKTPLWRRGPLGPKSLCNACGIRFKKSRRFQAANEGLHLESSPPTTSTSMKSCGRPLKRKLCKEAEGEIVKGAGSLKRNRWSTAIVFKRECVSMGEDSESCLTFPETASTSKLQASQTPSSSSRQRDLTAQFAWWEKQRRLTKMFAEDVEEAAFLLMALSCGLVLA